MNQLPQSQEEIERMLDAVFWHVTEPKPIRAVPTNPATYSQMHQPLDKE